MGVFMEVRDCFIVVCVYVCKFGWFFLLRWGFEIIFVSDEFVVVSVIIVLYILFVDSFFFILVDKLLVLVILFFV